MADLDANEAGRAGETDGASGSSTGLAQALQGAVFPLNRSSLVRVARENEADPKLMGLLSSLPEQTYRSEAEVSAALAGRP